jgi:hypothetical protein
MGSGAPVTEPPPLAVSPVIAVSRPVKLIRTGRLGLVRALQISLCRQLGVPMGLRAAHAAALAALFNGLLLTAGRYCQAWLAVPLRPVGGPWLREGERARGKRLPGGRGSR